MSESVEVRDVPAQQRFELRVDGELASFVDYLDRDGARILPHTQTFPEFGGRGHGTTVVRAALDEAIEQGRRIVPSCPFVRAVVQRDPGAYGSLIG